MGGLELEIEVSNFQDISSIKKKLSDIKNIKIRYYGSKKCVQIKSRLYEIDSKNLIDNIEKHLTNEFKIVKVDFISSDVSKKTINNTLNAIFSSYNSYVNLFDF
ncbi:MAG TPA: hypothetical protein ACYCDB_00530 [Candidatus Azoamicus sp.]